MSLEKLTNIFNELLTMDDLVLSPELSSKEVKDWDSFNHLNIMIATEEEFGIQLQPDEVESIKNVGELVKILNQKGCHIEW